MMQRTAEVFDEEMGDSSTSQTLGDATVDEIV